MCTELMSTTRWLSLSAGLCGVFAVLPLSGVFAVSCLTCPACLQAPSNSAQLLSRGL